MQLEFGQEQVGPQKAPSAVPTKGCLAGEQNASSIPDVDEHILWAIGGRLETPKRAGHELFFCVCVLTKTKREESQEAPRHKQKERKRNTHPQSCQRLSEHEPCQRAVAHYVLRLTQTHGCDYLSEDLFGPPVCACRGIRR